MNNDDNDKAFEELFEKQVRPLFDKAAKEVKSAAAIVQQLLDDLTKLEDDKPPVSPSKKHKEEPVAQEFADQEVQPKRAADTMSEEELEEELEWRREHKNLMPLLQNDKYTGIIEKIRKADPYELKMLALMELVRQRRVSNWSYPQLAASLLLCGPAHTRKVGTTAIGTLLKSDEVTRMSKLLKRLASCDENVEMG